MKFCQNKYLVVKSSLYTNGKSMPREKINL